MSELERQSPVSRDARANPGPGHYSSPFKFGDDAVQYTMRQKTGSGGQEQYPGPGQYDPTDSLTEVRNPYAKINPYHAESGIKETPGPGYY